MQNVKKLNFIFYFISYDLSSILLPRPVPELVRDDAGATCGQGRDPLRKGAGRGGVAPAHPRRAQRTCTEQFCWRLLIKIN